MQECDKDRAQAFQMKFIFALHCICLIATFADAGVPLPQPGDPQNNLSKNCQIPKCPETKIVGGEEEVVALPYPLDCLQYVECRGSQSRVLPCPPDEVFDKKTFCDKIEHSNIEDGSGMESGYKNEGTVSRFERVGQVISTIQE
ncbi:PREDICTED: uncharacterized protein LOC108579657 [Habropoda laboriosa]|uniref:uncharacterized protein LOC108579657 n=1 Tax=Habropoda laboriosa TaxID=597456 RepID=UPI00083E20E7|nr:PREDICTED: uncharacterized protein LOC108579657 [Habropoda laboriosa]